jgi:tetratricopeptide (TPR) repeat protein
MEEMSMRWIVPFLTSVTLLAVPEVYAKKPSQKQIADCQAQDPAVALKACSEIIDNPATKLEKDLWAYYNRGRAYRELKDYAKSLADFTLCIKQGEKGIKVPYRMSEVLLERGRTYAISGDMQKAEIDFGKAVEEDRTNPEALRLHGFVLNQLNRFEEAEKDLRWASMIADTNDMVLREFANALSGLGKYDEAAEAYSKALTLKPASLTLGNRAFNYFMMGSTALAMADIEAYLTQEPNNVWGHQFRGRLHALLGDFDKAQADITLVLNANADDAYGNYVQGLIHDNAGRPQEAKAFYLKAIHLDTNAVEAFIGLGHIALDDGNAKDAQDWFKKARATVTNSKYGLSQHEIAKAGEERAVAVIEKPKRLLDSCEAKDAKTSLPDCTEFLTLNAPPANQLRARKARLAVVEKPEMMLEDANALLAANPNDMAALFSRGKAHVQSGTELDKAIADFGRILAADARNLDALNQRALAYYQQDRGDLVMADVNAMLTIDPAYHSALWYGMNISRRMKNLKQAESFASRLVVAEADDAIAWTLRAEIRQELGDFKGAIDDASRAIAISPGFRTPYGARGKAYLALGDDIHAAADLGHATEGNHPDAALLADRAQAFLRMKVYGYAISEAEKALAADPAVPGAKRTLAVALVENGDYGKALAVADDVLKGDAKDESMHAARVRAGLGMENWDRALSDAADGLKQVPQSATLHALRASAHRAKKMHAEALADIEAALKLKAGDPAFHAGHAVILDGLNRPADALAAVDAAMKAGATDANLMALKAKQQIALGKPADALETLEAGLKQAPESVRFLKLMGDVYAAIGSKDLALQHYAKALDARTRDAEDGAWQQEAKAARAKLIMAMSGEQ